MESVHGSALRDEFAQLHYKDLVVRELLTGSIPAAGAGCAFSRPAVEAVAAGNRNVLFRTDSLTEDYEFGFGLKQYGLKQIFVRFAVRRSVPPPSEGGAGARPMIRDELLCIREYFPASFYAAVKQKSRWVLGIALQGWTQIGWQGDFWTRYMLYRDRKALITNLITLLGYVVALVVLTVWLIIWIDPDAYRYPPLVEKGSVLWYVILANAALLAHRLVMRTWYTQQLHGWLQAGLSIPRMVWGNVINFCATCRAIKLYARRIKLRSFSAVSSLLAAAACVYGAAPASAQDNTGFYVEGNLGYAMPDSVDASVSGVNSTVELDGTFVGGGAVGYRFPWVRVELNGSYRNFDVGEIKTQAHTVTVRGRSIGVPSQSVDANGDASAIVGLVNVYVDHDFGLGLPIHPYLGGGVGVAYVNLNTNDTISIDGAAPTFAWNLAAGLSYDVTEHITVSAGYRYLQFEGSDFSSSVAGVDTGNVDVGAVASHEFLVGLRYTF